MSLFAESGGVVGIACDRCRVQIVGEHLTYAELLRMSPGWTLAYCPDCRPGRRGAAGTPHNLLGARQWVKPGLPRTT